MEVLPPDTNGGRQLSRPTNRQSSVGPARSGATRRRVWPLPVIRSEPLPRQGAQNGPYGAVCPSRLLLALVCLMVS